MLDKLPDSRITPYRADLASAALRDRIEAARYVEPWAMEITADVVPVRGEPRGDARQVTQALHGEPVLVYEQDKDWSWVQIGTDDYIGYVQTSALGKPGAPKTHKVSVLRTYLYPVADLKSPPLGLLSLGSQLAINAETNGFLETSGGFVTCRHVVPLTEFEPDFVAVAARFLETPYLWGGRSSLGLDCSALVQLSLGATGVPVPRDSDMQLALGTEIPIADAAQGKLARGDLVLWRGHIGIMTDNTSLLHANGYHMTTVIEPVAVTIQRISDFGEDVIGVRRLI